MKNKIISFSPDGRENPFCVVFETRQKDWNDSRRIVLDKQKIAAPKKSSTFAVGFLISLLKT